MKNSAQFLVVLVSLLVVDAQAGEVVGKKELQQKKWAQEQKEKKNDLTKKQKHKERKNARDQKARRNNLRAS